MPGNDIVAYGEEFNDLVMVQESVVTLNLRIDQHKMFHDKNQSLDFIPGQGPKMIEFFILLFCTSFKNRILSFDCMFFMYLQKKK